MLRRLTIVPAAVLAALLIQLTVLNNLPFPGGSAPDLVLVLARRVLTPWSRSQPGRRRRGWSAESAEALT